jgi:hypothetical protein
MPQEISVNLTGIQDINVSYSDISPSRLETSYFNLSATLPAIHILKTKMLSTPRIQINTWQHHSHVHWHHFFFFPSTSYLFTSFLYSSIKILGYQLVRGLKKWNEAANRLLKIVTVDNLRVSSGALLTFDVRVTILRKYSSWQRNIPKCWSCTYNGRTVTSRV